MKKILMVLLFIFIVGVGCASAVNLDNGANAHLDKVVKDSEAIPISSDDFLGSSASTKTDPGSGWGSARPDYTDVFNSDIKNATLHPIHPPLLNSTLKSGPYDPIDPQYLSGSLKSGPYGPIKQ